MNPTEEKKKYAPDITANPARLNFVEEHIWLLCTNFGECCNFFLIVVIFFFLHTETSNYRTNIHFTNKVRKENGECETEEQKFSVYCSFSKKSQTTQSWLNVKIFLNISTN